ncbi:DoxX family protein [Halanaeroarchaeum sp. HSR-CO]|uniref:DoxX family protein n=1 Tax=Halanaeroarchaeum sp. HSR-CO TaxID=2866382 RepID=UPI00217E8897|nr:DoxX family protein [Halanaeroarchaeum sp. HSR-CO]
MPRETVRTSILGYESQVPYSPTLAGYALVAMRLSVGWVLFDTGMWRLSNPTWSTAGLFGTVSPANPLSGVFAFLGESLAWLLDPLLVWGLVVVGAALIFGVAVRLSAAIGVAILSLLWAASLPLGNAFLVDQHVVYIFVLFALWTFGAGRIVGLDAYFESHPAVKRRPWLRYLLG